MADNDHSTTDLRILTLNCWGIDEPLGFIPVGSKDRNVRMQCIADKLSGGEYDLVALQEVWSESDYQLIQQAVSTVLPYSHYFHSGYLGSGVCVFTKGKIFDTVMHRYSLNGFAHHIHRGDWFGGKVVGLARIQFERIRVNLYSTHVHAEYNKTDDLYTPHRIVQTYELSQFVNTTAADSDLILVVGDFNVEQNTLGYQLVVQNSKLKDAWLSRELKGNESDTGNTCDVPESVYLTPAVIKEFPEGSRIDYIMYRPQSNDVSVTCLECHPSLGRIPTHPHLTYSDHMAVYARIKVHKKLTSSMSELMISAPQPSENLAILLQEALVKVDEGMKRVKSDRKQFGVAAVALMVAFVYTIGVEHNQPSFLFPVIILLLRFFLTLFIGWIVFHGLIGLKLEEKALKAAKSSISVRLSCFTPS